MRVLLFILSLLQFGLWKMALEMLDEMGEPASGITYNIVLSALSKAGEGQQALTLLDRMNTDGRMKVNKQSGS